MTDAEIIKALECHTGVYKGAGCVHCAFTIYGCDCLKTLNRASLDLINRQKAEIERLKAECGNQSTLWSQHYESIYETSKETIKSEAIKEFAERLKDYYIKNRIYDRPDAHTKIAFLFGVIKNLVKEMAGDTE